jgi:hypothetical protein
VNSGHEQLEGDEGTTNSAPHAEIEHEESHQSTLAVSSPVVTSGHERRKRKPRAIELRHCECGIEVSQAEIDDGGAVMKCRVAGCETIWVSSHLDTVAIRVNASPVPPCVGMRV